MQRPLSFAVALWLLFASLIHAGELPTAKPEAAGMSSEKLANVSELMQQQVEEGKIAGGVVAIARNGKVVFFEAYGERDLAENKPMKKDTIVRLYSMTKAITTAASLCSSRFTALETAMELNLASAILVAAIVTAPVQTAAQPPRLLGWDAEQLAKARRQLNEAVPTTSRAWKQLQGDAEHALDITSPSVMSKVKAPPSGDKHDYMSFGPYWWPDPSKVDGLPYVRRDGEVNPESRGPTSDWRSLKTMTDAVTTLSLAYYFSGNEHYASKASEHLRIWFLDPDTRMNPHLRYGQGIPGRTEGRGIGIIETRQLLETVEAAGLLAESDHWTKEDDRRLQAWFRDYLDWLVNSRHGRDEDQTRNNHGTWYDAQVVAFAWFTGQEDRARERLKQVAKRRIDTQIAPDGRQPEELARTRSFDYSTMNARGLLTLATYGKRLGVDLWRYRGAEGQSIPSAVRFLAQYADPNVEWTFEQIKTVNRGNELRTLFAQAAATFDCRHSAEALRELNAQDATPTRARLLWPSGWGGK